MYSVIPEDTYVNSTLIAKNEELIFDNFNWQTVVRAILTILPVPGIICYIALFFIIAIHRTKLSNSYYWFMCSLSISNAVVLSFFLTYATPSNYYQLNIGGLRINSLLGAINNAAWFSGIPMYQIIAVNRFLTLCNGALAKRVFTTRNVITLILLSWSYGITYGIISCSPCCYFLYSVADFAFSWDITREGAVLMSYVDLSNSAITCITCLIINMFTLWRIRKSNFFAQAFLTSNSQIAERKKTERKLFVIFLFITSWLLVHTTVFIVVPLVTTSVWGGLAVSVMFISHLSADGFVNLLCNNVIRRLFFNLVKRNNQVSSVQLAQSNIN